MEQCFASKETNLADTFTAGSQVAESDTDADFPF